MAFEDKGWRGATFEHVAVRAGVTRGALHHHFPSKAALLEQALSWGWAEYGSLLFSSDQDRSLSSLLTEYVRLLREDALFRALAASTVLVAPQASGDSSEKNAALDAWRDDITAMARASGSSHPEATSGLVLVLLQGLTVSSVTRPRDLPHPDELSTAMAALARGLRT